LSDTDSQEIQIKNERGEVKAHHVTAVRRSTVPDLSPARQAIGLRILDLLIGASEHRTATLEAALRLIMETENFTAVGLRLTDGDDFPFATMRGFGEIFVGSDNSLCVLDESGEVAQDARGKACLDCMCGRVIRKEVARDTPWVTSRGTFWTASSTKLRAAGPTDLTQMFTRTGCFDQGFESVALIPVERDGRVAGLLMLCDSREGALTPDLVQFYERIADSIGIVLTLAEGEEKRCNLEAQLRQAQKLESLGVLAGGIAHDFNNLLMGILGNADVVLDKLGERSPVRGSVQDIEAAAKRAAELCRQLLAYSGRSDFVVSNIKVNELVAEMAQLLEFGIGKNVVLVYDLADNLPLVSADGTQLRQVMMNLIINASDAIGTRSGRIWLRTGALECSEKELSQIPQAEDMEPGLYVYMEVSDNGSGMDGDTRKKIFDPFFTTKSKGRGLGLAAVLGIVHEHGGTIVVSSEIGVGTTFKVLLPTLPENSQGPVVVTRKPKASGEWQGSGTIMLVDDEPTVRAVGKRMLERLGFDVVTAADGEEAVDLFRSRPDDIACVLMDLTMPHLDGREALAELQYMRSDVKVIISSGYGESSLSDLHNRGVAGLLCKPYQFQELANIIKQVLNQ